MSRHCNLVFQGGGVLCAAYAGAIAGRPEDVTVHAVGGTSGGAIIAALIALGKSHAEIKEIAFDDRLRNLLPKESIARQAAMVSAAQEIVGGVAGLSPVSLSKVLRLVRSIYSHRNVIPAIVETWNCKGIHSSSVLRAWLDEVFQDKKFADVVTDDLKIVAADVGERRYKVFQKSTDPTRPIAEAVHASVSIPLFFQPLVIGPDHYVDGGILSNFPSFLFVNTPYPTIGFRLKDISAPQGPGTVEYLRRLLMTMSEAHDAERGDPPHFLSVEIEPPRGLYATKFLLEKDDVKELYKVGEAAGRNVNWKKHSSNKAVIAFFDPNPQEALATALRNAGTLLEQSREYRVERLDRSVTVRCKIERDWSTSYQRRTRYRVEGTRPLFVTRAMLSCSHGGDWGALRGLTDLPFWAREIDSGGSEFSIPSIPAQNTQSHRAFLLLHFPPIASDLDRTIEIRFSIKKELSSTLGRGHADHLSYTLTPMAESETAELQYDLLLHHKLPKLVPVAHYTGSVQTLAAGETIEEAGEIYRRYAWKTSSTAVVGNAGFRVEIDFPGESALDT